MSEPVLSVRDLATSFVTDEGVVPAVKSMSLELRAGHTLGLVGESGSGKSVTSLSVMGLLPAGVGRIDAGAMAFLGQDLVRMPERARRGLRGGQMSMIFQEPGTSLNPVMTVGEQVAEALRLHQGLSKREAQARTIALFEEVGIPDPSRRVDTYPHEMSGGQKQRVMIAMALSCDPKLLIADEPTTALDVTIQAQILDLLRRLRDERGMAILFITHDLGVIAEIADEVAVMLRGELVETGTVEEIFRAPQHPYTKGLLACRPRLSTTWRRLPTVDDFMEVREVEGKTEVVELPDPTDSPKLQRGRGRLLHPEAELAEMGHGSFSSPNEDDAQVAADTPPLLAVEDLRVHFPIRAGLLRRTVDHVRAVDGVSFRVYRGQTLGLVGESGCGKTTTGRAILRILEGATISGAVKYRGQEVYAHDGADLREFRRRAQIVFQDPFGSLNPRMTVRAALVEAMSVHDIAHGAQDARAAQLLEEVGLGAVHLDRYPHEFSGGQRQRIGIARALAVQPEFIICDESVSALDVSVQAQVLNLLKDLQEERELTYLFISHDLSVVKFAADMMVVMNAGKIVEQGPSDAIYAEPREAYTQRLIAAIPDDSLENIRARRATRAELRAAAADTAGSGSD